MPASRRRPLVRLTRCLLPVLFVAQIIAGLVLIGLAEFYNRTLPLHLPADVAAALRLALNIMMPVQFYGLHVVVHYACGLPLLCGRRRRRHAGNGSEDDDDAGVWVSTRFVYRLWHLLVLIVALDGPLVWWLWHRAVDPIVVQMGAVLKLGMSRYLADAKWRHAWNEYQRVERCCGVLDYRDWWRTTWLDVDEDGADVRGMLVRRFAWE